ncbi:MAG TPA: hypothetical protein VFQ36_19780 [Ktedonobacteraceae bacterium]|nr:hypothetical protein [Ktedonobacteraceae bacterium]
MASRFYHNEKAVDGEVRSAVCVGSDYWLALLQPVEEWSASFSQSLSISIVPLNLKKNPQGGH